MTFTDEMIKILDDLGKRIGFVAAWSNKNVVPYLKELMTRFITWEIATSIIWIVLGVVMTVIGIIYVRYIWKRRNEYEFFGDFDEGITWLFVGFLALAVIGVFVVVFQCFNIVQAIYMPEMTIYQYINNLISASSE